MLYTQSAPTLLYVWRNTLVRFRLISIPPESRKQHQKVGSNMPKKPETLLSTCAINDRKHTQTLEIWTPRKSETNRRKLENTAATSRKHFPSCVQVWRFFTRTRTICNLTPPETRKQTKKSQKHARQMSEIFLSCAQSWPIGKPILANMNLQSIGIKSCQPQNPKQCARKK